MMLYVLMFDPVRFYTFAVMVGCVSSKASVRTHGSDDVVIHAIVKGNLFNFIGLGGMKNRIVLCELRQDWFGFFAVYQTLIPHVNFMKKIRWEGIKLCEMFK